MTWFSLGLLLGVALAGNLPSDRHVTPSSLVFVVAVVVWLAWRMGRKGQTVTATATATAVSQSTAAVQVVVVPAGADGEALARLVGSRVYTVDAPEEVAQLHATPITEAVIVPQAAPASA